jgi:cyclopropane-fatty-acyl-phospholipid synthase
MAEMSAATAGAVAIAREFLTRVIPSPRLFDIRLWDGTLIPADQPTRSTMRIDTPGAVKRMFAPPVEYNLAEAYIRGDYEIEGSLIDIFPAARAVMDAPRLMRELPKLTSLWPKLPNDPPKREIERGPAQLSGTQHSKERDKAALQYHYDVGNDFYALWLGRQMVYTCAYFITGDEDISTAQEQKLHHICRKLRLKPGERLLDIGCGWGGLVIHAAQHYGVQAVGVTLAKKQWEFANERIKALGLQDRAEVRLMDYRDLGDESFDKLVSIGMFEAVGRSHMPEYFAHAFRLLKPHGVFLNHGISAYRMEYEKYTGLRRQLDDALIGAGKFNMKYIFPDGELVPLNDVNRFAEEAGFEVRDVENLREHYSLTLRRWVAGLEAKREEAIAVSNETTYRTWRLYMSSSAYGFDTASHNINQTLLCKLDKQGRSCLPLTRNDWYD